MQLKVKSSPVGGWPIWGRPLGLLLLVLLGPLTLFRTPLSWFAAIWASLLLLGGWAFLASLLVAGMVGSVPAVLGWVEWHLRRWVAWFAPDPATLWLHWARHAHYPETAHRFLDRAVQSGGAEALFQEGLVFLEGGFGFGGEWAAVERFRRAAALGHAEAAFRLAEALRTGARAEPAARAEAEAWYRRAASLGFGPAAAWLAWAYQAGEGVGVDEALARHWEEQADRLRPHPGLSRSLLRHDAAPEDPLVQLSGQVVAGLESGWDRLLARPGVPWVLGLAALLLGGLALLVAGTIFWAGSSNLFHLPLLMLAAPLLMLGWQAWGLRKEGPRRGRDRLREDAEAGDAEACFQMGLRYQRGGPHLPKDSLGAALWFRKAAEAGHRGAMTELSQAYLGGHGVVRNSQEAARWADAARRESTS
jgi:hypothetical protein